MHVNYQLQAVGLAEWKKSNKVPANTRVFSLSPFSLSPEERA